MHIFYKTELNRDCHHLNVLAFGFFFSSNQIMFLKNSMKMFIFSNKQYIFLQFQTVSKMSIHSCIFPQTT